MSRTVKKTAIAKLISIIISFRRIIQKTVKNKPNCRDKWKQYFCKKGYVLLFHGFLDFKNLLHSKGFTC